MVNLKHIGILIKNIYQSNFDYNDDSNAPNLYKEKCPKIFLLLVIDMPLPFPLCAF